MQDGAEGERMVDGGTMVRQQKNQGQRKQPVPLGAWSVPDASQASPHSVKDLSRGVWKLALTLSAMIHATEEEEAEERER
ncbi:hypothetical protein MKZ38_008182 [Zalerion maritima]|uniref:Uncharacterized protein n=1 Tax=Zalerion maritima TaxID=339359 RepID=A0AAD5RUH1_9PEZI|nr:hypothetical protein MKZ38_008182 [Zalerion maritima]